MISSDTTDNRRTFDENRIAQFESDAIPQYRTVIRAIDMASLGVADVKALNDLMTAFGYQVEYFLQCFQSREYRRFCQGNRYFEWRNRLVLTQKAENTAAKAEGRAPQSIFGYPGNLVDTPCRRTPGKPAKPLDKGSGTFHHRTLTFGFLPKTGVINQNPRIPHIRR